MEEQILIRVKTDEFKQLRWFLDKIGVEYEIEKGKPQNPSIEEKTGTIEVDEKVNPGESINERMRHINQLVDTSIENEFESSQNPDDKSDLRSRSLDETISRLNLNKKK